MGLNVHNGAADAAYNSYSSLAEADTYHADRASPGWSTATVEARTAALIRATDYIDATYTFVGDLNLPIRKRATQMMALHALMNTLAEQSRPAVVEEDKELSGVAKKRVKYSEAKIADLYPLVSRVLAPITVQASGVYSARIAK
jgi:hypothetical protein